MILSLINSLLTALYLLHSIHLRSSDFPSICPFQAIDRRPFNRPVRTAQHSPDR